jgi:NADPH:quinone reductase-like Zn-dependent oxidoreductase
LQEVYFVQKWIAGELTEWMTQFTLGSILLGMLAEYVVLDETGVVPIPEHLTDEEAATLPSAALTAWHCLMTERGILTPGHRESFEAMNRAIAISQLHPVIDRVFDFEQAQAAFDYMDSGKYFGKVVIGSPKIG